MRGMVAGFEETVKKTDRSDKKNIGEKKYSRNQEITQFKTYPRVSFEPSRKFKNCCHGN